MPEVIYNPPPPPKKRTIFLCSPSCVLRVTLFKSKYMYIQLPENIYEFLCVYFHVNDVRDQQTCDKIIHTY